MRLSVSNLAWPSEEDADALALLVKLGVQGVEVAPTRLPCSPAEYRNRVTDAGLTIPAMQAILYGKPDLQLFGDLAPMHTHFTGLVEIAHALGASVMVFGAPANRKRGTLPPDAAWGIGRDRLRALADWCGDITIAIEPIPGAEFLMRWFEVWYMVREVDHPNLRVHLDTACVAIAGDDIAAAIRDTADVLAHYHASQPGLGDFSQPLSAHFQATAALQAIQYKGWMSIEMRQQPDWRQAIRQAVQVLRRAE